MSAEIFEDEGDVPRFAKLVCDVFDGINNFKYTSPRFEAWVEEAMKAVGIIVRTDHTDGDKVMPGWCLSWARYLEIRTRKDNDHQRYLQNKTLWRCCTQLYERLHVNVHTGRDRDRDVFQVFDHVTNRQNKNVLESIEIAMYRFYHQFSQFDRVRAESALAKAEELCDVQERLDKYTWETSRTLHKAEKLCDVQERWDAYKEDTRRRVQQAQLLCERIGQDIAYDCDTDDVDVTMKLKTQAQLTEVLHAMFVSSAAHATHTTHPPHHTHTPHTHERLQALLLQL